MITLKLNKSLISLEQAEQHPIFKKKIISYPSSRASVVNCTDEEYKSLLIKNKKYEDDLETNELLSEIHDFEKRNFGKGEKVHHYKPKPLDPHQRSILSSLTLAEVNKIAPEAVRPETSMSPNALSTYIRNVPTWCNADDLLQIKTRVPLKRKQHAHQFTTPKRANNEHGIEIVQKDLIKYRKAKDRQFNDMYRMKLSQDTAKREMITKKQISEDREALRTRQRQRIDECANMGQEWAIKMKNGPAPKPEPIRPPSPTEVDAMQQFNSRYLARLEEERISKQAAINSI